MSTAGRIFGPGIGDNSTGVAALLLLAETLKGLPEPPVDIWLVANTGEEGLGDLRGMRAAVDRAQDRRWAPPSCSKAWDLAASCIPRWARVDIASGARRPAATVGAISATASAIHALALLAADIARMQVPDAPRTAFNIGRIQGGRSINTIAQEAMLELDLRSEDQATLAQIVDERAWTWWRTTRR